MLFEIICDKFKNNRVEFHDGLNTVLGDDLGSNSIGKSTFLLIIDFVFGGKDYVTASSDIQRNIGGHLIKYCFIFDKKKYCFSRHTDELEFINICDDLYNIQSSITIDEYFDFLKDIYKITLEDISFRNIVSRFSRIYGKDNLDEKRPLNVVHNEKAGAPITALLKLFDMYSVIAELDELLKNKEAEFNAFREAQKYEYIDSIGKRQFTANEKELDSLNQEREKLTKDLDRHLLDLDSIKVDELLRLKNELSIVKRKRSKLLTQLKIVDFNIDENKIVKNEKFEELLKFFPQASIRNLSEIESFHSEIRTVLKIELKKRKEELEKLMEISEKQIICLESEISEIIQCSNLSKVILTKYTNIQKRLEKLENENGAFKKFNSLKQSKEDTKIRRDAVRLEQLHHLQNIINLKMKEINDYIYEEKKKPPNITFKDNQYIFYTMDDTGTGTSYKSMVVYDLSILEMTQLPILIHDSVVLKQISDLAIEKILLKYNAMNKQIFISLDKVSSYSNASQIILRKNKVLELSTDGNELFGWSWNDRQK